MYDNFSIHTAAFYGVFSEHARPVGAVRGVRPHASAWLVAKHRRDRALGVGAPVPQAKVAGD